MSNAEDNMAMYTQYLSKKAANRNNLLTNSQVTWQDIAHRHSKIKALQHIAPDSGNAKVLDVGCGNGLSLLLYLDLGFSMNQLTGIDIWDDQINNGKAAYPGINFIREDASKMPFESSSFDIVTESTMFLQMTDDSLAGEIAAEMIRVLKVGGHLILTDWRYGKPGNNEFKAVNKKRIAEMFLVGQKTELVKQYKGALVPPLGRLLSQYLPALYMPVRYIFPFTVGLVTTVLRKV